MDLEELIWKLIDITDIKKEYLIELNELLEEESEILLAALQKSEAEMSEVTTMSFKGTQEAMHKIQRMLMNLDEEFLSCMNQLKEVGDVVSIAELDGHRYTRLRDLQKVVEDIIHIETLHEIKKKEVHDLKNQWLSKNKLNGQRLKSNAQGRERVSELYKKAQPKAL